MAQTIDGSVRTAQGGAVNSLAVTAFANTNTNDVIVLDITLETLTATGAATVTSITHALTFTRQSSVSFHTGNSGNSWITLERWWAVDPGTSTAAPTANFSIVIDDATIVGYCVTGCRTSPPVFDPGANASKSASSNSSSAPALSGFTTTYDKSMLLMSAGSASTASSPGVNTAGTVPATFTLLDSAVNAVGAAWVASASEQLIVATVQTNIAPNFSTAWANWTMLGDALLDATATTSGAAITPAFLRWSEGSFETEIVSY